MTAKAIERLERGLEDGLGVPVELERPSNPEHGDYATNAALRAAPVRRKPPMEIAEELRVVASGLPGVLDAAVAPPGFVNLQLDPGWYREALAEILEAGADYGSGSATEPEKVQVEFVSANPTGPLTVASARNAAYGDSVARLLDFAGHTVEREFYVNDAGAQIDLFHASVDARRRGEDPPPDGYQGDYIAELAVLDEDPVAAMQERIRETLERFRVHMDLWVHQSEMEEVLDEALAEIELYEADGARWLATTRWGDDKDRVVVRADGRPTSRTCASSGTGGTNGSFTSWEPTITATSPGSRRSLVRSATTQSAWRSSSTSSSS
jgi:arginyl-tRNA synthetase